MIASRPQSFASVSDAIEWQCVVSWLAKLIAQRDIANAAQSGIRARIGPAAAASWQL